MTTVSAVSTHLMRLLGFISLLWNFLSLGVLGFLCVRHVSGGRMSNSSPNILLSSNLSLLIHSLRVYKLGIQGIPEWYVVKPKSAGLSLR